MLRFKSYIVKERYIIFAFAILYKLLLYDYFFLPYFPILVVDIWGEKNYLIVSKKIVAW